MIVNSLFNQTMNNTTLGFNNTTTRIVQVDIEQLNKNIFNSYMIPSFIYILFLLLIGLPGNALVCYIYHFKVKQKKLSSNIFILALSWFDLVNVTLTFPFELSVIYNFINFDHPMMCKFARFTTFFCNNSTSVILLAIACDRFRVFLSGPRRRTMTEKTSRVLVAMAMVISAIISWPMLVLFGTWTFPISKDVSGKMCLITNYFAEENKGPTKAFIISLLCLHLCVDLAFITIYSIVGKRICYDIERSRRMSSSSFNKHSIKLDHRKGSFSSTEDDVFITQPGSQTRVKHLKLNYHNGSHHALISDNDSISSSFNSADEIRKTKKRSLRQSIAQHSDSFRNSFKSRFRETKPRSSSVYSDWRIFDHRPTLSRTSLMLFTVTIAYMVTYLPYCILALMRTIDPMFFTSLGSTSKAVYQVFFRSYCLGSAINPIIYSFISLNFRKKCKEALKDLFCLRNKSAK